MDFEEKVFEAYVDAIKLCRWFILTVVLLSGLLFAEIYVEESNEQKINEHRHMLLYVLRKEFTPNLNPNADPPVRLASMTNITEAFNTLKTLHFYGTANFGEQTVPLLEYNVPGDYYETILAMLLAVFSVGVWLNMRSVHAAREALLARTEERTERRLKELLRVYRVFNNTAPGIKVALVMRLGAFLALPVSSLGFVVSLDYGVFGHKPDDLAHHAVSELALHKSILLAALAVTAWFGFWSLRRSEDTDKEDENEESERPHISTESDRSHDVPAEA